MLDMMIHIDALVCDMLCPSSCHDEKHWIKKNDLMIIENIGFVDVFVAIMIVSMIFFVFIQLSYRANNINGLSVMSWFKVDSKLYHVFSQL